MSAGYGGLEAEERNHLMDAWKTSEDVAKHFNELLLGFRLKAIGGIAVGAVGAAVSIGFKFGNWPDRIPIYSPFVGLAVVWLLVWAADFFYYYRLLAGAVDELLRLERKLGNVHLSHLIERRVRGEGQPKNGIESLVPYEAECSTSCPSLSIWVFYGVPALLLIGLVIVFACDPPPISPKGTTGGPVLTMIRPIVYVASPYTKGDPAINTHFQCKVFNKLMDDGKVWPVVPLWAHFQHTVFPRPYQDWIAYDKALLPLYDACLRLNAEIPELNYSESESSGADGEAEYYKSVGKPVFYSIEELYEWVDETATDDT